MPRGVRARSCDVAEMLAGYVTLVPFALIWLAHIGMDRMLGHGLKYPTHFEDTHLQRV